MDKGEKRLNRLIREAEKLQHCSDGYIESQLWANRDYDTSLTDIKNAVAEMRGIEAERREKQLH